jgi:hypothetical protein
MLNVWDRRPDYSDTSEFSYCTWSDEEIETHALDIPEKNRDRYYAEVQRIQDGIPEEYWDNHQLS